MNKSKIFVFIIALGVLFFSGTLAAQKGKPVGPKPAISNFSPITGAPGAVVEIFGNNFSPDYTVWLGTTKVEVLLVTMKKLKIKIPENAMTGRFVLKGKYIIESGALFKVVTKRPAPRVDGFTPSNGPPGAKAVINGANFSINAYENTVMLGNTQIPVQSSTPGEITVVIPKDAVTGKFAVTVAGGGTSTSKDTFTVNMSLQITDFSPKFGPPGTVVTMYGSGFGDNKKLIKVTMGGQMVKVTSVTPDKIQVVVPAGAIDSPFILSKGNQKTSAKTSFDIRIPPTITSFSPLEGFPGTVVTLTGSNFGSSELKTKVKLGDKVIKILSVTDNKIEVQVPEDAPDGRFTIEISDKGSAVTDTSFSLWVLLQIASFSPEKGQEGTIIKIAGKGFLTDVKLVSVQLGSKKLKITGLKPEEISVKVPAGVVSGELTVFIKGRGTVKTDKKFLVVHTPQISNFTPDVGQVGTMLTVYGNYFGYSTEDIRVWIGPDSSKQYCIVQQISGEKLTCQVQPNTVSGPLQVHVKDMGNAVSLKAFKIEKPLAITSVSPLTGLPGTTVTISGTGFSGDTNKNIVKIGKVTLTVVKASSTQLVVQIPENMVSGGNFKVSVKGKKTSSISTSSFDLIIPVKVAQITPKAGPIGTTVRIQGQGFGSDIQMVNVTLLGFYCPILAIAPNEIQVQIPPGLVPDQSVGKFQVIANPGGIAQSPVSFKVTSKHPKGKSKKK